MSSTAYSSLISVYDDQPHDLVTAKVLEIDGNERDFDIEAHIQFVSHGQAVLFDLSAFTMVLDDDSNLEEQRDALVREIAAANSLLQAVEEFHSAFILQASKALDNFANLGQATA